MKYTPEIRPGDTPERIAAIKKMQRIDAAKDKLEGFATMAFVAIPQPAITDPKNYRKWIEELEERWMTKFNSRNMYHNVHPNWNDEVDGIGGFLEKTR